MNEHEQRAWQELVDGRRGRVDRHTSYHSRPFDEDTAILAADVVLRAAARLVSAHRHVDALEDQEAEPERAEWMAAQEEESESLHDLDLAMDKLPATLARDTAELTHLRTIATAAREYVEALRAADSHLAARVAGDALDNAEAALIAAVGDDDA